VDAYKLGMLTFVHFVAACAFWLAAFGAVMGVSTPAIWTMLLSAMALLMTFPLSLLSFLSTAGIEIAELVSLYVFLALQLVVSFCQVKLIAWSVNRFKNENQPDSNGV